MQSKLVTKHPSLKLLSHKQIKTTFYLKTQTPYVSALKRINKLMSQLQRHGSKYVTVLGMGKASEKTLAVACYFQEEKGKKVEVLTQSIDVLDEIVKSDPVTEDIDEQDDGTQDGDREVELQKRTISGVEVRIYA
ncbi:ribonuclease P/MRP protein subunit POP7 [Lachancea thermotolerans CBS 6340]|uniref:KLTH0E13728p n=1 Tax=Lachancea thermotolerans (strain ATCC 56472 / CBS 6340 / NRRL Y-8284) TaxID=559295 RepID=C5DIM7_LACTC|nr:KLTH0E13728p [Lachancea thermotolerans CBS 6340]CAR23638.1 KLTH0E13728p [Lachancea thermotolerans CBS 6340]